MIKIWTEVAAGMRLYMLTSDLTSLVPPQLTASEESWHRLFYLFIYLFIYFFRFWNPSPTSFHNLGLSHQTLNLLQFVSKIKGRSTVSRKAKGCHVFIGKKSE